MIIALYIGTDRLTLFKDDDVIINNSVARAGDITKVFTDVSNSFSVPADDVNNKIFSHYYNSSVLNGFDGRKKVDGAIYLNGLNYKVGKFTLTKVIMKGNKPSSYTLDFFGNLVDLKDLLKDDRLTSLDLSAYDIGLNDTTVVSQLQNEGDTIMSLFADKRYVFDSVNTIATTDQLVNIAYNDATVDNGISYLDFKASIKNLRVIEAIEAKYNLTFSRDFFGLNEFESLYMLLSNQYNLYNYRTLILGNTTDPTYNLTGDVILATGIGTPTERETVTFNYSVTPALDYIDDEYNMYITSDNVEIGRLNGVTGLSTLLINVSDLYNAGGVENVEFWIESANILAYSATIVRFTPTTSYLSTANLVLNAPTLSVSKKMPTLKTIDYLSGLFKMFKLVAIPQKDGSIFVDTLERYYTNGKVQDVSKFVDYKEITVSPETILNEINYQFQDPKSILNQRFKEINGVGYGDLDLTITDSNGNLIDGGKIDYKLPFEQVVYEKIYDLGDSNSDTGIQYALLTDTSIKPVDVACHLHYNYLTSTDPIKLINQLGVAVSVSDINSPIHTAGLSNPIASTTFGTENNEYDGALITQTLYSNHHEKYISDTFDERQRKYTLTTKNISNDLILNLELNDVLKIKDKYFRIDSYKSNIITRELDFNLKNAINLDLTPFSSTSIDSTIITIDSTLITIDAI